MNMYVCGGYVSCYFANLLIAVWCTRPTARRGQPHHPAPSVPSFSQASPQHPPRC